MDYREQSEVRDLVAYVARRLGWKVWINVQPTHSSPHYTVHYPGGCCWGTAGLTYGPGKRLERAIIRAKAALDQLRTGVGSVFIEP